MTTAPKTILVATDFAPCSDAALDYAVPLARALGAKIHLFHAYELPVVGLPDGVVLGNEELEQRVVTATRTALAKAIAKHEGSGVTIEPHLREADPREGILAAAKELAADLIVVGTHGRKGFVRALVGSVAELIVRAAVVPVTIVRLRA